MSTRRRASITRASSPPEATLRSGRSAGPSLAAKANETSSPGSAPSTRTRSEARGMASSAKRACTAAPRGPAPARRVCGHSSGGPVALGPGPGQRLLQHAGPMLGVGQLVAPAHGLLGEGEDLLRDSGRTCGRAPAAAAGAGVPPPTRRGRRRSPRPASGPPRQRRSARPGHPPVGRPGPRTASGPPRPPTTEPSRSTTPSVALDRLVGPGRGQAVSGGVGQQGLAGVEYLVLVGPGQGGGLDLVDLVLEQLELTGPGPLVAPERIEGPLEVGQPRPGGAAAGPGRRRRPDRGRPAARTW